MPRATIQDECRVFTKDCEQPVSQALHLRVNASYEQMLPQSYPYMQNYLAHLRDLSALGNTVRISVENTDGDIFDPAYLDVLAKVTDKVMVTKGVNRGWVKSLWLPTVRWTDVTAQGYAGGPVMPCRLLPI